MTSIREASKWFIYSSHFSYEVKFKLEVNHNSTSMIQEVR